MSVLEVQNVCYDYVGRSGVTHALKGVSGVFESGRLYALTGRSGSGKSTLLSLLAGFDRPKEGKITLDGQDISTIKPSLYRKENVGIVFQSYNLIPTLSCQENILLPALYQRKRQTQDFDELVELLDIGPLLNQRVNTLSGGEKQRVAIARALILDPCLILADEPTGNLDPKNRDLIMALLRREHEKGRGVILITHDMALAKETNEILLLQGGKLRPQNGN